jgi:5'-nucleotidase
MRILLTNDDGIDSPGIILLAEALRKAGHRVYVLAPKSDQSGSSHSITFIREPCKVTQIGEDSWSCGGTPADCVVIGLLGGIPDLCTAGKQDLPDLVISGINRGANLGTDIVYSGTAAAARQGSFFNVPSLALSLVSRNAPWHWDMAIAFVQEHLDEMIRCWKPRSFINVNIPNQIEKPTELVHAFPSLRYYNDSIETYHAPNGHRYCFLRAEEGSAKPESGSDWDVVMGNNASISEICIHPFLLEMVKGGE